MRPGVLVGMVLALAGLGVAMDAGAARQIGTSDPLALARLQRPGDAMPKPLQRALPSLAQSRLVATYGTGKGKARLYLAQTRKGWLCAVLLAHAHASGTGCMPAPAFFGTPPSVAAISGRYFAGVAANDVARVVVTQRNGVLVDVPLTADHGFIVACTGPDQCACAVAWVDAYNASGALVSHARWLAPRCWRVP
ncbi:MAG TPA: hypothetical protein VFU10_09020 [Gaiellaceae bacterium]|nr:hypothetical protein [Gaiellaceae bacterium]